MTDTWTWTSGEPAGPSLFLLKFAPSFDVALFFPFDNKLSELQVFGLFLFRRSAV